MHVDRSNTDELYDEARNDAIEVEANLVQRNDANLDADVDIDNDTFSFTDGSNLTYCNTHTCGLTGRRKRIRGASSAVVRDMLVDNFQGHPVPMMNRESITDIFVDEENQFKYMFLAFGACVRGYRSMRKVVSIDGTWLKDKYNGVLLVASAQDGNYHQYPLAWGIVDVECTSSWSWFLMKLLEVVPDEDELVIISDRHQGIINAVSTVYRNAHHGHCTWHLSQNLKARCKNKGATEINRYPEAAQYLDERDSLDRWTRAYCPKTRYNIMTTNGVESINARLLEERKLPIIALLDSLQKLASSWFARYRHASIASNANLTPTIEGILRSRFTDAQGIQVLN
ncbi:uncharacterized protein [Primulina eburnea]|uniref:uncharacterized protein n=1 Tax=Primulina eburnea TaxID=1245227 RepID=UPI003C6C34D9